jgi:crotonobetaine/carnitine-CoA ligase
MHIPDLSDPATRIPCDVLRRQVEVIPDQLFLLDESGASHTYAEADDLADRHARGFFELGVAKGDRVALLMESSASLAVTTFGINRLGAIWSPVSTEYRGEWLRELLVKIDADVLVVDAHLLPVVAECGPLPFSHVVVNGTSEPSATVGDATHHDLATFADREPLRVDCVQFYGDTNAILWTSGTTGPSKGVMQSHNVWITWSEQMNKELRGGIREGERFYCCLPMYNSGGWIMNIYPALITGTTACIDKRFSVSSFWDRVRHYGASHTLLLGTMTHYLLQVPPGPGDADNPMRTMVLSPNPGPLMRPIMERFGIERVGGGFGQSEIMGATFYSSDWDLKVGSCGYCRDTDLVETKLLDDFDREVGVGEIGEFCIRPRQPFTVFNGYFGVPDTTIETFRNMWHHSGDLGRRDEDGELFFVDRKKDSLRYKGRNTSTFEVEHIARKFPGVLDAAAVGVTVETMEFEEELMVFLKREPGASVDPLDFCRYVDANAPYFFVPRYVEVVDEFPATPTNKVQKFKLRERGIGPATWDLERAATDWKPTRPPKPVATSDPVAVPAGGLDHTTTTRKTP